MEPQENTEPGQRSGPWEYAVAAALFLLGLYVAFEGANVGVGTLRRMGPGFLPVAVGCGLALLALGIFFELRSGGRPKLDAPVRPLVMVTLSLGTFAATVAPLGLVPATVLLVLIGAFAERAMTFRRAGLTAIGLAALGYVVFILGFKLPLDAFWG